MRYARGPFEVTVRVSVLLPLLFLGACGLFGVEPTEGDYDVTIDNVDASSACESIWGLEITQDDDISVEVEVDDDSIEFVDYFEDCDRDGSEFDCESSFESEVGSGYDAVVYQDNTFTGAWVTPDSFAGEIELVISCGGSDCGDLSTDCEVSADWTGELDE